MAFSKLTPEQLAMANELFYLCDSDGYGKDFRFLADRAQQTFGSTDTDGVHADLRALSEIASRIAEFAAELADRYPQ
ncbi:hypothetical protein [Nocardia tengchongensis]|uniref:hypothetical protein n=1 Tax=Nocardia tengchongensis TaxID=2055889 RepID=UPI003653E51E